MDEGVAANIRAQNASDGSRPLTGRLVADAPRHAGRRADESLRTRGGSAPNASETSPARAFRSGPSQVVTNPFVAVGGAAHHRHERRRQQRSLGGAIERILGHLDLGDFKRQRDLLERFG